MSESTKDISKRIRNDLKVMKGYKFSVMTKRYSGGSSVSIGVMAAPLRMIRTIDEIPVINDPENTGRYTRVEIAQMQLKKYHQLNEFQLRARDDYTPETWNNGVFLTEYGHDELKKMVAIVEKYHRDSSDSSIDYFNCNFYFHLSLGKWDCPFIDGTTTTAPTTTTVHGISAPLVAVESGDEK